MSNRNGKSKAAASKSRPAASRALGAKRKADPLFPSSPLGNQLFFGDCLDVLVTLNQEHGGEFIDLIYIDPPFNSKRVYNRFFEGENGEQAQEIAFRDTWGRKDYQHELEEIAEKNLALADFVRYHEQVFRDRAVAAYLTTMAARISEMHRALKSTGAFYLHCDPTMSHSLKLLCDVIFGRANFRNEIVWCYTGPSNTKRHFPRKHDTIFFYVKSKNSPYPFNYDLVRVPYTALHTDAGESKIWRGKGVLSNPRERNRILKKGKIPEDWWDEREDGMTPVSRLHNERVGWQTQKPLALAERIIKASSNPGDLVADFFGGCGTTVIAAQKHGRRWLACDISESAVGVLEKRIRDESKSKPKYDVIGFPVDAKGAQRMAEDDPIRFQEWAVRCLLGGEPNPKRTADGGYDGHLRVVVGQDADGQERKGTCLIEIKGGNATIAMVRAFATVIKNRNAEMGVFVCFEKHVTRGMEQEAAAQGSVESARIPRLQIRTVERLLDGDRPRYPAGGLLAGLDK